MDDACCVDWCPANGEGRHAYLPRAHRAPGSRLRRRAKRRRLTTPGVEHLLPLVRHHRGRRRRGAAPHASEREQDHASLLCADPRGRGRHQLRARAAELDGARGRPDAHADTALSAEDGRWPLGPAADPERRRERRGTARLAGRNRHRGRPLRWSDVHPAARPVPPAHRNLRAGPLHLCAIDRYGLRRWEWVHDERRLRSGQMHRGAARLCDASGADLLWPEHPHAVCRAGRLCGGELHLCPCRADLRRRLRWRSVSWRPLQRRRVQSPAGSVRAAHRHLPGRQLHLRATHRRQRV